MLQPKIGHYLRAPPFLFVAVFVELFFLRRKEFFSLSVRLLEEHSVIVHYPFVSRSALSSNFDIFYKNIHVGTTHFAKSQHRTHRE